MANYRTDAVLHVHRLRDWSAILLRQAKASFDAGDGSQTAESVAAIRDLHRSFQQRAQQIDQTLPL
jgi:hypothetical protein